MRPRASVRSYPASWRSRAVTESEGRSARCSRRCSLARASCSSGDASRMRILQHVLGVTSVLPRADLSDLLSLDPWLLSSLSPAFHRCGSLCGFPVEEISHPQHSTSASRYSLRCSPTVHSSHLRAESLAASVALRDQQSLPSLTCSKGLA